MPGRIQRFGIILAILCGFHALDLATFWLRGADLRYAGLVLVIMTVLSALYAAAFTLTVGTATLNRPLPLLAYHVALGVALYLPGVLLQVDARAGAVLQAMLPLRVELIPYAAYWLFLLAAVALSCYQQFNEYMQN
jgi:hypothetical protein